MKRPRRENSSPPGSIVPWWDVPVFSTGLSLRRLRPGRYGAVSSPVHGLGKLPAPGRKPQQEPPAPLFSGAGTVNFVHCLGPGVPFRGLDPPAGRAEPAFETGTGPAAWLLDRGQRHDFGVALRFAAVAGWPAGAAGCSFTFFFRRLSMLHGPHLAAPHLMGVLQSAHVLGGLRRRTPVQARQRLPCFATLTPQSGQTGGLPGVFILGMAVLPWEGVSAFGFTLQGRLPCLPGKGKHRPWPVWRVASWRDMPAADGGPGLDVRPTPRLGVSRSGLSCRRR